MRTPNNTMPVNVPFGFPRWRVIIRVELERMEKMEFLKLSDQKKPFSASNHLTWEQK